MTNTETKQARNRDAGLPGHPTRFAPRTHGHASTDADLGGIAAGFGPDSLKPWDDQSETYSLVETRDVVNSPGTELQILLDVANADNVVVKRLLAQSGIDADKSQEVFEHLLSTTDDSEVLRLVAQNKAVPSEMLDNLTLQARATRNDDLASAVAGNPSTSDRSLEALHTHPSWEVRYNVAGNPSTPTDVLLTLAKDSEELVAARAVDVRNEREWMDYQAEKMLEQANYVNVTRHANNVELVERFADQAGAHERAIDEIVGFIPDSEPPF